MSGTRMAKAIKSQRNLADFPVPFPWEDFDRQSVTLASLLGDSRYFEFRLGAFAEQVDATLAFTKDDLRSIVPEDILGTARVALLDHLLVIGAWYLLPKQRAMLEFDIGTTRQALAHLHHVAPKVADELELCDRLMSRAFEHLLETKHSAGPQDGPPDLRHLSRAMREVGNVAGELRQYLATSGTGRPEHYHQDVAVQLAMEAMQLAGLGNVGVSRGKDSAGARHLTRPAGALLRSFFRLLDRSVSEPGLAGSVMRARQHRRAEAPTAKKQGRKAPS